MNESILESVKESDVKLVKKESLSKLAVFALQKQVEVLKLKEFAVMIGFIFAATFLRGLLKSFPSSLPSVEPITFFAILTGWLFGPIKGFTVGSSSLFLSNFMVLGGQGLWTPFQMVGFGAAGFLGGFLRKKASIIEVAAVTLAATALYEIFINFASILFGGYSIFAAFIFSIPFSLAHIGSNFAFSLGLPAAKRVVDRAGGFSDAKHFAELVSGLKSRKDGK
ncbi:ECF transporter S component [Candidatus Woesearchaeota archaeon]|nr:ECF transporter S component [Candidatus Woesearchaeota archaeon]